jgi:hypothetical protein
MPWDGSNTSDAMWPTDTLFFWEFGFRLEDPLVDLSDAEEWEEWELERENFVIEREDRFGEDDGLDPPRSPVVTFAAPLMDTQNSEDESEEFNSNERGNSIYPDLRVYIDVDEEDTSRRSFGRHRRRLRHDERIRERLRSRQESQPRDRRRRRRR